ncbi:SHOCT domain-containing protein [Pseudomonadales bacterium]|nr:SHOCT domain-containing protein [Pseudomonadales bacterium]MDB4567131.1 SHOCT domain-containing protein [Pseudomonadales bacterium]
MLFRDSQGETQEVYKWSTSSLAILFFSPVIYFAYKRIWSLSLTYIFITLVVGLGGASWILDGPDLEVRSFWFGYNFVWAILTPHLLRAYYKKKGWIEVLSDDLSGEINDGQPENTISSSESLSSGVDELVALKKLLDEGVINEDVFERKKKEMGFGD